MKKLNTFDWTKEFPELTLGKGNDQSQGFDCVIGNPPYVRQEILGEDFKKYAQSKFKSFAGTADLYVYFIEKALNLVKKKGIYSVIVANKWMRANYGEPLRRLLKQKQIQEIIDFGDLPVFSGATTYPCIIKINNGNSQDFQMTQIKNLEFNSLKEVVNKQSYTVDIRSLDDKGWSLSNQKESALLDKIKKAGIPLGEYVEGKIYYGIKTGLNEAFVVDEETKNRLIEDDKKSVEIIKPFLAGRDVKRYKEPIVDKYLIFTRRGIDIKKYPAILKYLEQYKEQLKPKPKDWPAGKEWKVRKPGPYQCYKIQDSIDYYNKFEKEKIVFPDISTKGNFTLDINKSYLVNTSYIIPVNDKYLLANLNSKIATWFYSKLTSTIRGGYLRWIHQYVSLIPIPKLLLYNLEQKEVHDKIVSLVDTMLLTQKEISSVSTDTIKKTLNQKIELIYDQINALVYGLYGLTEEEIKIIESNTK